MAEMVPKGPRATDKAQVRDITSARSRGGRPSGLGYDPAAEEEHQTGNPEVDYFAVVGQRGYSEDRFYTKSTNTHNHGEKLNVRVPQGIDSQVYAAVNQIPEYRHINDLVRDAIIHRLEYLQRRYRMGDDLRRQLELERLESDNERSAREIEVMERSVANLNEHCQAAYEARDYGLLAQILATGDEIMEWLREPYHSDARDILGRWRDRARQQIADYGKRHDDGG